MALQDFNTQNSQDKGYLTLEDFASTYNVPLPIAPQATPSAIQQSSQIAPQFRPQSGGILDSAAQVVQDVAAGFARGAVGTGQGLLGTLSYTGLNPNEGAYGSLYQGLDSVQSKIASMQSDKAKQAEAAVEQAIKAAKGKGFLEGASEVVGAIADNPYYLVSGAGQVAGSLASLAGITALLPEAEIGRAHV